MFAELVELGKRIYKGHDALGMEKCSWDIVIDRDGNFKQLIPCDIMIEAEKLSSKKSQARLLLDKAEETLYGCMGKCESEIPQDISNTKSREKNATYKKEWMGFSRNQQQYLTYINKLQQYKDIKELSPVIRFYNNPREVEKAWEYYSSLPENKRHGNMTFMVDSVRLATLPCVIDAIKEKYEQMLRLNNGTTRICAVCGSSIYPILYNPHGSIKMPKGPKTGSVLVSYNTNAFESYNLKRNENSWICTNCARSYVEALSFLTKAEWKTIGTGDKVKKKKEYKNAIELSDDTLIVFWTKEPDDNVDPWSDICQPTGERIKEMFPSVVSGNSQRAETDVDNYFYCCTLSSAAARIAVRDWMAVSISEYQDNLRQWFDDIVTIKNGEVYYPGINTILDNCIKKKSKPTQGDFKARARIGTMLWHAALTNTSLPATIIKSVMTQIEHEKTKYGCFNAEKASVIRLVLNRHNKNKSKMKNELDKQNASKAYLCGRLFALICKLQFKAQGTLNSSIKDRFFASASNSPARVMGLLLTKYVPIYEKKTKGAFNKAITEVAVQIDHFPAKFSVMERGEFALGYYYQYNTRLSENTNNEQQ